jgi:acetylornithine aminotransferase
VTKAIQTQAENLIHTSNLYRIGTQEALGDALMAVSGMDNVFFANSGAEANEAAIKIARLYGHNKGIKNPCVVVANKSFHGRTMATLTASGNRKIQAGFEPLLAGFVRVEFNDIENLKTVAKNNSNIVAILVEPIQGEGGVNIPDEGYLKAIRDLCDQHGWLMMLDEVQTGNARTGKYFAYQHEDILPDVVTTAKGLGNGVPIGACLAQGVAAETFAPGNHGSTFGGNPLVCAAGLAVVNTIENDALAERATLMGAYCLNRFNEKLSGNKKVSNIRGKGLMMGITLNQPCAELVAIAKDQGLLINVTDTSTIRLLPPLILSESEADLLVDGVVALIQGLDS